jgi:4-diphosphocytidyl-2-C-methyl-D-erythritol kinase
VNVSSGITFLAPAKINISLRVFGKRPDGYHHIRSVMVPVTLYDEVAVEEAPSGIVVETDAPAVPADGTNSCCKAAAAFMRRVGVPPGVRIRITKRIPTEAGLGGGSSDAAATLKGLAVLSGRIPSDGEMLDLAVSVGADVPFFVRGTAALAEGFGERLTPVAWKVPFCALIVKPPFGLPTREGYARLERGPGAPPERTGAPSFEGWDDVTAAVSNDFEEAWTEAWPEIRRIKERLLGAGARAAGLTGSGSAVYGLFETEGAARKGLGELPLADGHRYFIARNI